MMREALEMKRGQPRGGGTNSKRKRTRDRIGLSCNPRQSSAIQCVSLGPDILDACRPKTHRYEGFLGREVDARLNILHERLSL